MSTDNDLSNLPNLPGDDGDSGEPTGYRERVEAAYIKMISANAVVDLAARAIKSDDDYSLHRALRDAHTVLEEVGGELSDIYNEMENEGVSHE